jgi:hypothetical protein
MKTTTIFTNLLKRSFLIPLFACSLLVSAKAVTPPPDGGYPGGNTAEGESALLNLNTGTYNTAIGFFSLESNDIGDLNTAVGAGALATNTADNNTATGAGALLNNNTGTANTAAGVFALFNNTTGDSNTAFGFGALGNNTTASSSTAVGANALLNNTTASGNTAVGSNALSSNTTGGTLGVTMFLHVGPNVAVGESALASNTIASANTAVGYQALGHNTTGLDDTDLSASTAVGFQTLANATGPDSAFNDAFGYQALFTLTGGHDNVSIGTQSLYFATTGSGNVALGSSAGNGITTGSFNICIGSGNEAGNSISTASNVIAIGTNGANVNNSCYIGNIFNSTSPAGAAVFVNSDGKLGTSTSSRRFKEEIKPMEEASEAVYALKPVIFRYKKEIDPQRTSQFGLVAEDVEKVNPELVVRDKDGKPYTVRYDQVNAMLLNEFLKEHRTVQKQGAMIARQQKQIEELSTGLQKVSTLLATRHSVNELAVTDY